MSGHEHVLLMVKHWRGRRAQAWFDSIIGRALLARLDDDQALAQLAAHGKLGVRAKMTDQEVKAALASIRRNRIARS